MTAQPCAACGFTAADYTREDLLGTFRALAPIWRTMTVGIEATIFSAAPPTGTPSLAECVATTLAIVASATDAIVSPSERAADEAEVKQQIVAIDKSVARIQRALGDLGDDAWQRAIAIDNNRVEVIALLAETAHGCRHALRDGGRALHALGAGAPTQHGTLVQINTSGGGVPKSPRPTATIDGRGLDGDTQAERRHHGRPFQAVSLWSEEVMSALCDEGHSVYPGAAGENLTVRAIDWTTLRPGVRMAVGPALLEISAFATPCAKNAQWFSDRNFRRIDHTLHPGWSRAYAWVLEGGAIAPGDAVVVEP